MLPKCMIHQSPPSSGKVLKASLKEKMSQNNSRMELEWKQTKGL